MGNVIFGAVIGALVGLGIGALPHYDGQWQISTGTGWFTLELHRLLHPMSMMIGTAAGSVVGAIAGRVAADPNSTPLPTWVIWSVLIAVLLAVVLGAVLLFWKMAPSDQALPHLEPAPKGPEQPPGPKPNAPEEVPPVRPGAP